MLYLICSCCSPCSARSICHRIQVTLHSFLPRILVANYFLAAISLSLSPLKDLITKAIRDGDDKVFPLLSLSPSLPFPSSSPESERVLFRRPNPGCCCRCCWSFVACPLGRGGSAHRFGGAVIPKGHSPFCPFVLYPRGSRNLLQSILSVRVRGKGVLSAALLGEKQAAKKRRRRRDERMRGAGEGEKTQLIPFGLSARVRVGPEEVSS